MSIEHTLVAVLSVANGEVVGAGIVVGPDLIVTCAHVVNEALGRSTNRPGRPSLQSIPIRLHLPNVKLDSVIADGDESWVDPPASNRLGADLCVLRLTGAFRFTEYAPLATSNDLTGLEFRSVGFPLGWDVDFAKGEIRGRDGSGLYLLRPEAPLLGAINARGERWFNDQPRPPGLIHKGFSGGPVEVDGVVVGILVEARDKISDATAYMVPVSAFPSRIAENSRRLRTGFRPPRPSVPFIGRDSDVDEVIALLHESDAVVISSTLPGIGKTTVAAHVAQRMAGAFPDGVLWIKTSNDAASTLTAANAMITSSVNPLPSGATQDGLAHSFAQYLSTRRILVVYDDIRFVEGVNLLLPTGGESKFLLTTRSLLDLDLYGVVKFPLSLLNGNDALLLLKHTSGKTDADFSNEDSKYLVAELGYLPLAIKLAGRTIRMMNFSIAEYIYCLKNRPDLSWLDLEDSHESLSGSFYLSYRNLASDQDRTLFRSLGLFRSVPISIQAMAVAVSQTGSDVRLGIRNLLRAGLCDWISATSEIGVHPLLRRYAVQLSSNTTNFEAESRLAIWFTRQISVRNSDGTFRYSDIASLDDIEAARSAIHHLIRSNDYRGAQRIVEVIADPLTRGGQYDLLNNILDQVSCSIPLQPWLQLYLADMIVEGLRQGDPVEARSLLDGLSALTEPKISSAAFICMARDSYRSKNIEQSRYFLNQAKEMKETANPPDVKGLPYVLNELAKLELLSPNGTAAAVDLHETALGIQRSIGDIKGQAHTLRRLGSIYLRRERNLETAAKYLGEACLAAERAGSTLILVHSLIELAEAKQQISDFQAALTHLDEASRLANRSSDPFAIGRVYSRLGQLFERIELWGRAKEAYAYAVSTVRLSMNVAEITKLDRALSRTEKHMERLNQEMGEWSHEIACLHVDISNASNDQRDVLLRRRRHASRMLKRVRQKLGLEPSKIRIRPR